jgi:hypothetical protein
VSLLRDQIRNRRALEIVAEVGPAAEALAERLPPMFDGDDDWLAVHAAIAYWHVTGDAEPVVPVLLRHIACEPRGVPAVRALADIGGEATAAIPVLERHAWSPHRQTASAETSPLARSSWTTAGPRCARTRRPGSAAHNPAAGPMCWCPRHSRSREPRVPRHRTAPAGACPPGEPRLGVDGAPPQPPP